MRPFETLLLLACVAWFIQFASVARADNSSWSASLQFLLGLLLVLQVLLEGWRWQIFPLYAVTILGASGLAPVLFASNALRLLFTAAGLGAAAASLGAALIFQHLEIFRPSGPSLVGITTLRAVTREPRSRVRPDEEFVSAPLVQLWYPAAPRPIQRRVGEFLQARLAARLKRTDSVPGALDAPPEPGTTQWPVVVYFGGWPEDSLQNRSVICELVSRGFAVASLYYPQQPGRPMLEYTSDAAFKHTVELDDARVRTFARDASATLDALARLDEGNTDRRFVHRLNLQRTGILGYSFGGAVAAQAPLMDPRFQAAVNLDGRHWAEALRSGVRVAYLYVGEELLMPTAAMLSSPDPATRYEAQMDQADYTNLAANLRANGGIQVTIEGMEHPNFSDDVLRSPLRRLSGGGAINARRGLLIVNSLVAEFFGQQLAQRPARLLAGNPRPFPEARADYWRPNVQPTSATTGSP
jgi:dienelactone hydrolase